MPNSRILICSSAWKEALTSLQVNQVIGDAIESRHPNWQVLTLPWSDGGDDFLQVLQLVEPTIWFTQNAPVHGPVGESMIQATYLRSSPLKTVVIEAAAIHGLRLLPGQQRYPMTATSYGIGELFQQLSQSQTELEQIILTVGGSASTDGGVGFLQGLGWQFYDSEHRLIAHPIGGGDLLNIHDFQPQPLSNPDLKILILTDVHIPYPKSPICFAAQKGASPQEIQQLSKGFDHIQHCLDPEQHFSRRPGTGAAGGLPFGVLCAYPHAKIESGNTWLAREAHLDRALSQADLVITGEGCFDQTSLLGKGTGYLLEQAASRQIPVVIFCGKSQIRHIPFNNVQVFPLLTEDAPVTPERLAATSEDLRKTVLAHLPAIAQMLVKQQV